MRRQLLSLAIPPATLQVYGRSPRLSSIPTDARYKVEGATGAITLTIGDSAPLNQSEASGSPCLFENGDYDLYLLAPLNFSIQSEDHPRLIERVSAFDSGIERRVTHYRMSLSNDVGHIRIAFKNATKTVGVLTAEVYPTKIDYKSDYRAIAADLSRVAHSLIFTSMSKTNFVGGLSDAPNALQIEWYRIFEKLASTLFATVDEINKQPQRRLENQETWRPADRARLVIHDQLHRAALRPGNLRDHRKKFAPGYIAGFYLAQLPTRDWHTDFDTLANRYVKALLISIRRRLARIRRWLTSETEADGSDRSAWREYTLRWRVLIDEIIPQIDRRLDYDFLREAGDYTGSGLPPTMQSHPLYAKLFQISLALNKGLHIEAQEFAYVGAKPIWLLYEYWCYVALLELLHERLEFISGDIVQLDASGAQIALKKGVEASVTFRNRATGERLKVIYNRLYPTPTTWQRPDTAIHIETSTELHVFDAKYRVEDDPGYLETYGGSGPNLDDINTMHRYRDAIVNRALPGYPKLVRSAIVLFPSAGINYEHHRFFASVSEVGIGALPFLPSQKQMVSRRLETILGLVS